MTLDILFLSVMDFFNLSVQSEFVSGALALFILCVVLRFFWLLCVKGGRRDG